MKIFVEPFFIEKAGNKKSEYEDAFWPLQEAELDNSCIRLAVADGATESSFSGIWASQLVKAFGGGRIQKTTFWADIIKQQKKWARDVGKKTLPWYAEEKAQAGAFAAFLGLEFREDETGISWKALGMGDCCLFQAGKRANQKRNFLTFFPFESSASFGNRPPLISSVQASNDLVKEDLFYREGVAYTDDVFFLMSDAIACWFLTEKEMGFSPWEILEDLNTNDEGRDFPALIGALRQTKKLKNDDVTVLKILIGA